MPTTKTTKSLFKEAELSFDAATHTYWRGKKKIPGVSEILQKVGLTKDYKGVDPFYRDRGIATHKCIELSLKGILDETTIDPVVKPHFEAWQKYWASEDRGNILAIEKPFGDLSDYFAGTPDLVTDKALFDWKCSKAHDRVAALQGMAYKQLCLQNWISIAPSITKDIVKLPFIVVELHEDGTYAEFNYGADYELWSSVLDLWFWKARINA